MSTAIAAAGLGYGVKNSSDIIIVQSDVKTVLSNLVVAKSDIVTTLSNLEIVKSDLIVTNAIVDTIASDLVVVQSDVKVVISDLAALLFSAKVKSLLGLGPLPGMVDYFDTVADGADPETAVWSIVESGDGAVTVDTHTADVPGYVNLTVTQNTYEASMFTKDKRVFSLKGGATTLYFEAYVYFNEIGVNGKKGIGFVENDDATPDHTAFEGNNHVAGFYVDDKAYSYSSTGAANESSDLSGFISATTWYTLKIAITASDVKYYVDGTLRATHTTRVPSSVWQVVMAVGEDGADSGMKIQWINVWGE